MSIANWQETHRDSSERHWIKSLADDVLLAFAHEKPACYRALFQKFGPKSYQVALKTAGSRPDIGLEAFTWAWSRIRMMGAAAHPMYKLGGAVGPAINSLVSQAVYDLNADYMTDDDDATADAA